MQYESILKRKSVRKYLDTPLLCEDRIKITKLFTKLKPLFLNEQYIIKLVDGDKVSFRNSAPNYIEFFAKKSDNYKVNCGYMLSQLEIMLSEMGFGTCYMGWAKAQNRIEDYTCVLVLAVGYPNEPIYRSDLSEFKRKSESQLMVNIENEYIRNAIRYCPTAMNAQSYFVYGTTCKLIISVKRSNIIGLVSMTYSTIDIGILLHHIELACIKAGINYRFEKQEIDVSGYVISVVLE